MKNLPVKGYYTRAKVFGIIIISILAFVLAYLLYHYFTDPA